MKVIVVNLNYGLLVLLIWVPVIFSAPGVDFDIWGDRGESNAVGGDGGNWSKVVNGGDLNRLPRVLNFFPVPFVEECKANDGRRRGICMNTYECRIQGGKSYGFCALGFGVCCVFTATCGHEVINNLTYFVNPDFPDLTKGMTSCSLSVKKTEPEVSQIRFDFIHFNLGQPNRRTGVCEEDIFLISAENSTREVTVCGINSGQHVYFDAENIDELKIEMTLTKKAVTRFWEVIITQIPFTERSPPGCLQYFTASEKLTLNGSKLVLEKDGTEIPEDEILLLLKSETLMLLEPEEKWRSEADNTASSSSTITIGDNSFTSSFTEDVNSQDVFSQSSNSNILVIVPPDIPESASLNTNQDNSELNQDLPNDSELNMERLWEKYPIPLEKIPSYIVQACEKGNCEKRVSTQVINSIVDEMRTIKTNIPRNAFKSIARKLAEKFPKTFLDVDEDGTVLGIGTSSTVSRLLDRNNYLNRPHKCENDGFVKPTIPAKLLKKIANQKAGCSNWQPPIEAENNVDDLKMVLSNIDSQHENYFKFLEDTYAQQRQFLNSIESPPTIQETLLEWPVLLEKECVYWHFKKLTNIDAQIIPEEKLSRIIEFGKTNKIDVPEDDDKLLTSLKILANFFKEDISSFFYYSKNEKPDDPNLRTKIKSLQPCILQLGNTGVVQTMNFADNGRHLANQDYNICVRQELDMCSISYEPCHENAFRISPNTEGPDLNSNLMEGSGEGDGVEESFRALEMCNDKIVLPCDSEELLMPGMFGMGPGSCSLVHCGPTLCPSGNTPCRIESSATPFNIEVHFGESAQEASPEDNLGMCLTYEQIPCGE